MTLSDRYKTCGCCGKALKGAAYSVEPVIVMNEPVRYIPVLNHHSSYCGRLNHEASDLQTG